ncbi:carboxymuconolactone decarboxylase family protein [Vogesella sp. AC12]|uniref:carboxymuconolactone decarboxylase family protein n=1 Tax=Vogesella sp. AC12 TaxID=2950550 RepID=UPI00210BF04B|nr:carboxymuconolactone decarboxylase family protein [Vogesella sp. AC12]MCQ4143396.1 carboxymuconolactone decarboxylase family protein [Vogesella sp. AC12]
MQARLNFFKANPKAMNALVGLEPQISGSGLEKSLIELVRLRASQLNGCAYCIDVHTADARKAGETDRRLALLPVWREADVYSDREQAAFAWTEALTLVADSHVPDELWEKTRQQFEEAELVDLTLLVTTINTWNRFAIAFRKLPT